jgi:hypothetical protein
MYYKTNGILALKKHMDVKHGQFAKKLDEEVNSLVKTQVERQPSTKRQNVSSFFSPKFPYKKDELQQKYFFENLALLIVKNHLPIHFSESLWLKQFAL